MIKVRFDPEEFLLNAPDDVKTQWLELAAKANAATKKIINQWEDYKIALREWKNDPIASADTDPPEFDPKFDDAVWKGFRDWMKQNLFHNKCAYCEIYLSGFIPDAEHFRPKGKVTYQSSTIKVKDEDGTEIVHPGYFWLAYNWKNLLPSCHTCNRYGGKKTNFPATSYIAFIKLGEADVDNPTFQAIKSERLENIYYPEPEDLDKEEGRLLLHPFFDDPHKHIWFDNNGYAVAKDESPIGQASIDVFDLNIDDKVKYRNRSQKIGYRNVQAQIGAHMESIETMKKAGEDALKDYFLGDEQYAAAVFDYVVFFLGPIIAPERDKVVS